MVVQEHVEINGHDFIHTYSDAGRYIVGGEPQGQYVDAYDPAEFGRTYIEGDIMPLDDETLADKAEAYDILMGVE